MKAASRVFLSVTMVLMIGMLSASGVYGFSYEDLRNLKITNQCPNCDLEGANLSSANLSDANLYKADLRRANLSNANLSGAKLEGAYWTDGSFCNEGSAGQCVRY